MEQEPEYYKEPLNAFTFLPFGGGMRVCIGRKFAYQEMVMILSLVLQRYSFQLSPNDPPPEELVNITLGPKKGLHIKLVPRIKTQTQ